MKYHILEGGDLLIVASPEERAEIIAPGAEGFRDEFECLEILIANSDLMTLPDDAIDGDMTDAPLLGIIQMPDGESAGYREAELPEPRFGKYCVGGDEGGPYYAAVIARWRYMDYQVRSFVTDLIEKGECRWTGGYAEIDPDELDAFTKAYIEAMLWSSMDSHDTMRVMAKESGSEVWNDNDGSGYWFSHPTLTHSAYFEFEGDAWSAAYHLSFGPGEPDDALDKRYDIEHISHQGMMTILSDCKKFQSDNRETLEKAYADESIKVNSSGRYGGAASAGHDFWLTRNGHGCGFWDGDWEGAEYYGDILTAASKKFKELKPYVGDDGKIYLQ